MVVADPRLVGPRGDPAATEHPVLSPNISAGHFSRLLVIPPPPPRILGPPPPPGDVCFISVCHIPGSRRSSHPLEPLPPVLNRLNLAATRPPHRRGCPSITICVRRSPSGSPPARARRSPCSLLLNFSFSSSAPTFVSRSCLVVHRSVPCRHRPQAVSRQVGLFGTPPLPAPVRNLPARHRRGGVFSTIAPRTGCDLALAELSSPHSVGCPVESHPSSEVPAWGCAVV